MASPKFPEPPPSMPATPLDKVDALVDRLEANAKKWVQTPIPRRIQLLRQSIDATLAVAHEWVDAACRAKGIPLGSTRAGEEWLAGPVTVIRNLRLLIETLEEGGQPTLPKVWKRADGQRIAQVFPTNTLDKLMFTGISAEVWITPGEEVTQGKIYRDKAAGKMPDGGVALVLGAGNVASIGPMDALYKLFMDDEVVILKTNPVNAYLGPFIERGFKPFADEGFFAVVHGGAEQGIHLTGHDKVASIHITGSDRTHDAIVWGPDPEEAAKRKEAGTPINTKPITSELGCVTPVFIVPGPWSESDLDFQARHVAAMVTNNASFNCNAAKVLVTAKGWPQRDAFVARVREKLGQMPSRKAYYPGAHDRFEGFLSNYPGALKLSEDGEEVVPWTVIPGVEPTKEEYALTNEAFCGVLAEVDLEATTAPEFIDKAIHFGNEEAWGTLSTMMIVHPKTMKAHKDDVERFIAELRYGGIGVNAWAGLIYGLVTPPWGAYPGHTLEDIRSGRGVVHNTFLIDNPQKTVVRAPFRINPTPAWFSDHKTQDKLGEKMAAFEASPSWWKLPGVVGVAIRG